MTVVAAMTMVGVAPAAAGSISAQDVAEAGTIVASDVTPDFEASPPDESTDKALLKQAKKVKGCGDYVAVRKALDKGTDAESPDFQSNVEALSNHVYVLKNEKTATKVLKQAKAKGLADCFTDLFTKVLSKQLKSNPSVDKIRVQIEDVPDLEDQLGDQSVAYSGGIEATYTDGSSPDRFVVSNVLVRVGPAVLSYSYQVIPNQTTGALNTAINNSILRTQIALA